MARRYCVNVEVVVFGVDPRLVGTLERLFDEAGEDGILSVEEVSGGT